MAQKYYILQFSSQPTLKDPMMLDDWGQCSKIIQERPGTRVKSFKDRSMALEFIKRIKRYTPPPTDADDLIDLYVDGSFHDLCPFAGWAWVAIDSRKTQGIIHEASGVTSQTAEARNIDGELAAVLDALNWLNRHQPNHRYIIHHDYQGISSWVTLEWEAKSGQSKNYLKKMFSYQKREPRIFFKKVIAHSGNLWNDYVDRLAKKAIDDFLEKK